MKTAQALVLALAAAAQTRAAGPITEMTPALIEQAIKDNKAEGCYPVGRGIGGSPYGCFTTPYSRVVLAATAARKKYKPFTAADVTPEMLEPVLRVIVAPRPMPGDRPGVVNVEAVVVMPKGSKNASDAIHPTKAETTTDEFKNLMGAEFEGRGLIATFPFSVLSPANEFRFIFDGPACAGGWAPKSECAAKIEADKVR